MCAKSSVTLAIRVAQSNRPPDREILANIEKIVPSTGEIQTIDMANISDFGQILRARANSFMIDPVVFGSKNSLVRTRLPFGTA